MKGWGLGFGDWGFGPIPNPQSPIPNPQSPKNIKKNFKYIIIYLIKKLRIFNYININKIKYKITNIKKWM